MSREDRSQRGRAPPRQRRPRVALEQADGLRQRRAKSLAYRARDAGCRPGRARRLSNGYLSRVLASFTVAHDPRGIRTISAHRQNPLGNGRDDRTDEMTLGARRLTALPIRLLL